MIAPTQTPPPLPIPDMTMRDFFAGCAMGHIYPRSAREVAGQPR
jgi:hypothetical protein